MVDYAKVSVVIPVYNAEKYLRQALDTIIGQSLIAIEVICVDDGSVDGSYEILNEYAENDCRVKVLRQAEPSDGAALARNLGLAYATGKYVIFLDADDWFEKDMLKEVYEQAEKTEADVVLFDAWVYDDELHYDYTLPWILSKKNVPDKMVFSPEDCKDVLFEITGGQAWNKLYLREYIEKNKIKFIGVNFSDDQYFTFMSFALAKRMSILPKRLLHYRYNAIDNQSSKVHKYPEAGYMATDMLVNELRRRGMYEKYKVAIVNRGIATGITVLSYMVDEKKYVELYNALKDNFFKKWGCFEVPSYKIADYRREFLSKISSYTALGYLLQEHVVRKKKMIDYIKNRIRYGSEIVIYGAGTKGKQLFTDIINEGVYKIKSWVDINYKSIGYPVQKPEIIQNIDFDFVVVAIERRDVYINVEGYLSELGVMPQKILWLYTK